MFSLDIQESVVTIKRGNKEVLVEVKPNDPRGGFQFITFKFKEPTQYMDFMSELMAAGADTWPEIKKMWDEIQ